MFTTPPFHVLKRTIVIRLFLVIVILPLALLATWAAVAALSWEPPILDRAAFFGVVALGFSIPVIVVFPREFRREIRLHEEGVVQVVGARSREIRWADVSEVRLGAVRVRSGGLIGAVIGAAVDSLSHAVASGGTWRLMQNSANITVRVVATDGTEIRLTSNERGVVQALEEILARVDPRLTAAAMRRIQDGFPATFGKIGISHLGVSRGKKPSIPFQDLARFGIWNGKLRVKRKGNLLDSFTVPVKSIPNVFVLLEIYARLGTVPAAGVSGRVTENFARRSFV